MAEPGPEPDWLSLLMQEYGYLQAAIDKLDGQRFQIRNWAIAAAGALFTVSLSTSVPAIAFAGSITTLFFAFLETVYMQMVGGVIDRSNKLDNLVNAYQRTGKEPLGYEFGLGKAFSGGFSVKRIPETLFAEGRVHVTGFYLGLLIVTAAGGLVAILR